MKMDSSIYIFSYEIAVKKYSDIIDKGFKIAIADEVHALKSLDSKRSKTLVPILANMK
jgi:SNF2 family DNA or RNA helicase